MVTTLSVLVRLTNQRARFSTQTGSALLVIAGDTQATGMLLTRLQCIICSMSACSNFDPRESVSKVIFQTQVGNRQPFSLLVSHCKALESMHGKATHRKG